MQDNPSTTPVVSKSKYISPVWFLPFIATLLALWILFQNITHKNMRVNIHFTNAGSIIIDKTKVRYKGVIVGTVKKIELDEVDGVNVIAEIESHATFLLKEKSKFWLVSPKASLTSITGLDTLFSGSYINLLPGEGEEATDFVATREQPITIPDNALLINLKSDNAASINIGTPIFYKKIQVGEIARVRLDKTGQFVNIQAFIESKYSHLVKQKSKFWNISGLNANISRAGIDFKLDSLTTLIAGGVTFSSPESSTEPLENQKYQLFNDIDASQEGLHIILKLSNTNNLPERAGILFKGHGIGRIDTINYDSESQLFIAKATINPAFSDLITESARFWVEKTSVSFSKIENLSNLITGDYINFSHGESYQDEPLRTEFVIKTEQSILESNALSITLIADNANGLTDGAPVSYKGLNIGKVSTIKLTEDNNKIKATLNIDEEFSYLINKNSKFHLLSGVNFKASLKGVEVNSKPLENIIQGGIALYNESPITKKHIQTPFENKQPFYLYESKEMAKLGKDAFTDPLKVILLSKELPSVSIGSPVYYHKLQVGEVSDLRLHDSSLMQTSININAKFKHLITKQTIFWNISGFEIDAGLSGIKVNAASLLAVATGGIALEFSPSVTSNITSEGQYRLFDNYQQATQPPKQITLIYDDASELKVGNKVKLKGLDVGKISQLTLNKNNKIMVTLDITPKYFDKVAKQGSRFWVVRSDISLSGAKNLSTLISGVFINVEPGNGNKTIEFKGEHNAPLLAEHKTGLSIILTASNAGSTDISSPIYHRQIQIGEVTEKRLNDDASGVEIVINIYPEYAHLIRTNSIFWPASGFNLDIGITGASLKSTSLTSLIKGGINMSTSDNRELQPASQAFSTFKLQSEFDEDWLQWKLKIPKSN
ncbi:PqiB family protein [Psychromonas sp. L1A2]|uniref:PqiB family protein n=1 Tax=Psychromonas sp. L1A2 TaxID=2686356 RepID=UPI001359A9EB|nr:MlaD family protein [Psychromonas sp. L1A2]